MPVQRRAHDQCLNLDNAYLPNDNELLFNFEAREGTIVEDTDDCGDDCMVLFSEGFQKDQPETLQFTMEDIMSALVIESRNSLAERELKAEWAARRVS